MGFVHSRVQARILLGDISRVTKLNNNNSSTIHTRGLVIRE